MRFSHVKEHVLILYVSCRKFMSIYIYIGPALQIGGLGNRLRPEVEEGPHNKSCEKKKIKLNKASAKKE
jgi:hypothetical protein